MPAAPGPLPEQTPHAHALGFDATDFRPDIHRPCWLSSGGSCSRAAARDRFSPLFVAQGGIHAASILRLGVLEPDACGLPNQSAFAFPTRATASNLHSITGIDSVACAARINVALPHAVPALVDPASLEVSSPSALANRDALSGAASLRTIPLRRYSHRRNDPRVRGPSLCRRRPCGFPLRQRDAV